MLKKNLVKYKLIEEHMHAVNAGRYELARMLLRLLRKHSINVGLDDIAHEIETIAEQCGCRISYGRNYCLAYIRF